MEKDAFVANYSSGFHEMLDRIGAWDGQRAPLGFAAGVSRSVDILADIQAGRRKIYITGNGGSAAIASHAAIDLWKNGGIPAHTFNDSSLLTCIANDIGFEDVFAAPLDMFAVEGDLVICISSSGNSADIVKACGVARRKGCRLITLSGFSSDNSIAALGEVNFYVPSYSYGFVEILHQYILHCILDTKMFCNDAKDVFNKNLPM